MTKEQKAVLGVESYAQRILDKYKEVTRFLNPIVESSKPHWKETQLPKDRAFRLAAAKEKRERKTKLKGKHK